MESNRLRRELCNFESWMKDLESLGSSCAESVLEVDRLWLRQVVDEVRVLVSGGGGGESKVAPATIPEEEEDEEVSVGKKASPSKQSPRSKNRCTSRKKPQVAPEEDKKSPKTEEEAEEEESDEELKEVPVLLPKTPKIKAKRKTLKRKSTDESSSSSSPSHSLASFGSPSMTTTTETEGSNSKESHPQNNDPTEAEPISSPPPRVASSPEPSPESPSPIKECLSHQSESDVDMKEDEKKASPRRVSKPCTPPKPLESKTNTPCDSTFVLMKTPVEKPRRSSKLSREGSSVKVTTTKEKENVLPEALGTTTTPKMSPSPRRSHRLAKEPATPSTGREPLQTHKNNEVRQRRSSAAHRNSLSQYKGLVNKAIRTSITAETKRTIAKEDEATIPHDYKFSTPLNQTRKILRTMSATTSSGMKSSILPRSQSVIRHRSPLPTKASSTIVRSSRIFLSSKSSSKLVSKTRGLTPSNIVRGLSSFLPQKAPPVDLKAKQEEDLRRKQAKEEEALRRKEELARLKIEEKKSQREARHKKVLENKKMLNKQPSLTDLRKHELLQAKQAKQQQQQQEEMKKAKEREEEEEKARKFEIQRIQLEKKKLKEAQARLEEQKLAAEAKAIEEARLRAKAAAARVAKPMLNVTITKDDDTTPSSCSYDMTPAPEDLPPEPLKDEDNYDVGDLKSDDDTDDEEQPRKAIPLWATGGQLRKAMLLQMCSPIHRDKIFAAPAMPNLDVIFPLKKSRFFKRTSSAVWNKAPLHE
eukprot:TRINITY_DN1580_c0_g1_i3.p1 TRINITY_DN1580_c0_g1~~TRINITY_DN1580_c0_g1_i3.p1  ORF type:complete len:791 (+),score=295.84 TRINITY_DN1580_c0_g1_i3:104-2374(+)